MVFGVGEDGEEVQVIDLLPGQGLPVRDILDQASEVVGSHEDRLCNGDTWEISGRP